MPDIVFNPKPKSSAWIAVMQTEYPISVGSMLMDHFAAHIERGKKEMIVYVLCNHFHIESVSVQNVNEYVYEITGTGMYYLLTNPAVWVITFEHGPISDNPSVYTCEAYTLEFLMDVRSPIEIPTR